MAELAPTFEALENRLMRAWMHGDAGNVKASLSGDSILMFGTTPPVLLDRPSFVNAIQGSFVLAGFRFHEVTARKHGKMVWFTGHVEMELAIGQRQWGGKFLLTDLWRRTPFRRRWVIAERSLAPIEPDERISDAIHALQLWR